VLHSGELDLFPPPPKNQAEPPSNAWVNQAAYKTTISWSASTGLRNSIKMLSLHWHYKNQGGFPPKLRPICKTYTNAIYIRNNSCLQILEIRLWKKLKIIVKTLLDHSAKYKLSLPGLKMQLLTRKKRSKNRTEHLFVFSWLEHDYCKYLYSSQSQRCDIQLIKIKIWWWCGTIPLYSEIKKEWLTMQSAVMYCWHINNAHIHDNESCTRLLNYMLVYTDMAARWNTC